MKKIEPYNGRILVVPLALNQVIVIQMPKLTQVLGAYFDAEGALWLSAASTAKAEYAKPEYWEPRRFAVVAAWDHLPHELGKLTQVAVPVIDQHGIWHVFEIESPEGKPGASTARGVTVTNHQAAPVRGSSVQVGILGSGLNVGPGVMIQ